MDEEALDQPKAQERKSLNSNDGQDRKVPTDGVNLREVAPGTCHRRAIAAYSYEQVHPDELRLQVGDVVEVLGEDEEGWLRGRIDGQVGVFPANFVKMQDDDDGFLSIKNEENGPSTGEKSSISGVSSAASLLSNASTASIKSGEVATGHAASAVDQTSTISTSTPSIENELPDSSNTEIVECTDSPKKVTLADDKQANSTSAMPAVVPSPSPVESRKIMEIKNEIEATLKQALVPKPTSNETPPIDANPRTKEYAKVTRTYQAEKEGQLSLQVGNVVTILAKEGNEEWLGEIGNKRGTFPADCVATITSEEPEKPIPPAKPILPVGVPPPLPFKPPKLKPVVLPPPSDSSNRPQVPAETKLDSPSIVAPSKSPVISTMSKEYKTEKPSVIPTPSSPSADAKSPRPMSTKPGQHFLGRLREGFPKFGKRGDRDKSPSPIKNGDKASSSLDNEQDDFGGTTTETESLSHLTAQRPKNPAKRPPSQAFLKEMAVTQHPTNALSTTVTAKVSSPLLPPKVFQMPIIPKKPPRSPTTEIKDEGKTTTDNGKSDYVRREEFDQLLTTFEEFRRETTKQIKELESRLSVFENMHKV